MSDFSWYLIADKTIALVFMTIKIDLFLPKLA
jgi:hypothetical protein